MSQALQALNRILQYQQQRDRADVQESLAFMQFAQQKRATEIKEFGLQLDVLEKANQQQKINTAKNFIQSSGLNNVLALVASAEGKDSKEIDKSIGQVANYLQEKKYGDFNKQNAQEVSLALWSFKNSNDASSLLDLANKVSSTISTPATKDTPNNALNLISSFDKIGNASQMLSLGKVAKKIKKNEENLLLEKFQFAYEGDTKIQTGFGMYSPEVQKEYEAQKPVDSKVIQKADQVQSYLQMEQQTEPDDEGMNIPVGGILKGTAITGAIGAAATESQSQRAQKAFLDQVNENITKKVRGDATMMDAKEFKTKYKMTKKFAETNAGKKVLIKQALEYGKSQTTVGKGIAKVKKGAQWAKDININWKSPSAVNIGTFAAPVLLPMIGEAVGGEVGESVGTAASTGILTNKIVRSGKIKRSFVHHMASRFPMLAGKWGLVAMADSPAIPIADFVALGIAASDVYSEWQKWMVEE